MLLDDLLVELAAKLLVTLAADAEEFDLLALGPSAPARLSRARRTIEELKAPDRPRSPVQTSSRWTLSLPVPASRRGALLDPAAAPAMLEITVLIRSA